MNEQSNVLGSDLTTSCLGGRIDRLVSFDTESEITEYFTNSFSSQEKFRVLGAGSNVVISDAGIHAPVLKLGKGFRTLKQVSENRFLVGGSYSLMSLARELSRLGFSGLEFAGGIPASVGGAVFMNAGAHGGEMKDVLRVIHCVRSDGIIEQLEVANLPFRYRHSGILGNYLVYAAEIELRKGDPDAIADNLSTHLSERKKRQPLSLPSCGSVFKNPSPEMPAGVLIEKVGLKGFRHGGLMVSDMHANWIVNPEKTGKCAEFLELLSKIIFEVRQKFNIKLEPEVKIWE